LRLILFLVVEKIFNLSRGGLDARPSDRGRLSEAAKERLFDLVDVADDHSREVDFLKQRKEEEKLDS
jgi:hypothetical protein